MNGVMGMSRRKLATSDHPAIRSLRAVRRAVRGFTLPAPRVLVVPVTALFHAVRSVWWFLLRVLVAEPYLKAHCRKCGKGVRTDFYLHWIQGKGDLILGDGVLLDGKSAILFASRYVDHPTLEIGDHSAVGHNCIFTVADRITIGRHCRIASDAIFFDSGGHPADPAARRLGLPAPADEVKPIVVEDNVWIGRRVIVHPGVTIGRGSIVSAGAVVTGDVPPYTVAAGNPARRIGALTPEESE
jgi:acetyltransferase-like isoleucine patch superfamily enzyme